MQIVDKCSLLIHSCMYVLELHKFYWFFLFYDFFYDEICFCLLNNDFAWILKVFSLGLLRGLRGLNTRKTSELIYFIREGVIWLSSSFSRRSLHLNFKITEYSAITYFCASLLNKLSEGTYFSVL